MGKPRRPKPVVPPIALLVVIGVWWMAHHAKTAQGPLPLLAGSVLTLATIVYYFAWSAPGPRNQDTP